MQMPATKPPVNPIITHSKYTPTGVPSVER